MLSKCHGKDHILLFRLPPQTNVIAHLSEQAPWVPGKVWIARLVTRSADGFVIDLMGDASAVVAGENLDRPLAQAKRREIYDCPRR